MRSLNGESVGGSLFFTVGVRHPTTRRPPTGFPCGPGVLWSSLHSPLPRATPPNMSVGSTAQASVRSPGRWGSGTLFHYFLLLLVWPREKATLSRKSCTPGARVPSSASMTRPLSRPEGGAPPTGGNGGCLTQQCGAVHGADSAQRAQDRPPPHGCVQEGGATSWKLLCPPRDPLVPFLTLILPPSWLAACWPGGWVRKVSTRTCPRLSPLGVPHHVLGNY